MSFAAHSPRIPDDRWQTARDMMHELQWTLDRPLGDDARWLPAAPGRSRWRSLALVAGATALVIVSATLSRLSAPAPGPAGIGPADVGAGDVPHSAS